MDVIASGPFVPDSATFKDVRDIFRKYDLKDLPAAISKYIEAGLKGQVPETPKAGDGIFKSVCPIATTSGSRLASLPR